MHKQYRKHVIRVIVDGLCSWLAWTGPNSGENVICLTYHENTNIEWKRTIFNFTLLKWTDAWPRSSSVPIPRNYRYSSGLNDPTKYK
jgi:hypothetical protein